MNFKSGTRVTKKRCYLTFCNVVIKSSFNLGEAPLNVTRACRRFIQIHDFELVILIFFGQERTFRLLCVSEKICQSLKIGNCLQGRLDW